MLLLVSRLLSGPSDFSRFPIYFRFTFAQFSLALLLCLYFTHLAYQFSLAPFVLINLFTFECFVLSFFLKIRTST